MADLSLNLTLTRGSKITGLQRITMLSSLMGNAMEYYDFYIFATAASLVFDSQFFARSQSHFISLLLSYTLLAIGFIARPLGGMIFGRIGDKFSRRKALLATLILIGCATTCIAFIPPYSVIGIAAPILVLILRTVQGVAQGGEWGGAVTLTAEHIHGQKNSFYRAIPLLGSPLGTLLSTMALWVFSQMDWFLSYGWRIAFLLAFPLLAIALWVRFHIQDSAEFLQASQSRKLVSSGSTMSVLFKKYRRELTYGVCLGMIGSVGFPVCTACVLSYATGYLHVSRHVILTAQICAALAEICIVFLAGAAANRWGAIKVAACGAAMTTIAAIPGFYAISTGHRVSITIAMSILVALLSISFAVSGSILPALFPTEIRYTGVSTSFNFMGVFAGIAPLVETVFLNGMHGSYWPLALSMVVFGILTIYACVGAARIQRNFMSNGHLLSDVSVA